MGDAKRRRIGDCLAVRGVTQSGLERVLSILGHASEEVRFQAKSVGN